MDYTMPDEIKEEIRKLCEQMAVMEAAEKIVLAEHVRMLRGEMGA